MNFGQKSKSKQTPRNKKILNTSHKNTSKLQKPQMASNHSNNKDDGYCDLSIVFTNEEISSERSFGNQSIIKSAKQSLVELKTEALNCLDSSRKIVQNQKFRSSLLIPDLQYNIKPLSPNSDKLLKSLSQSLVLLNQRLSFHEEALLQQDEENTVLKSEIKDLENKLKVSNSCKLENSSNDTGCSNNCRII